MKKFFTIALALIAALMLTACSGKSLDDLIEVPDQDNTADSSDTSDNDDTDHGSDTNADTGDSDADTGDSNADTGDSNADTGDTNTDTGDTNTDTGDSDDAEISDIDNMPDNDQNNSGDDADSTDPDNDSDPADSGSDADSTDSGNDSDNDSADSDNDSDPADSGNDNDADNPETPESDCVGISIDWNTFVLYEGAFSADATIGNGNLPDGFSIEFDRNKIDVRQYDLGTSQNRQYHTCKECVMVYMDCEVPYVFYPDNCAAYFFQESGTLNITANDDATDKEGNIEGTLSAKLIEVELSGTEYDIYSTPVTNGKCVEIESGGTFQSTTDCLEINLTNTNLTYNSSTKRYETSYSPNTGNFFTNDTFTMQLRNISTGEYNLAGTNLGDTNGIFFVIYEDNGSKYYFQKKGTVNYNASTKKVQLNDVMLEEVTISGSSSTKVPYGSCLKVKNTTISY